MQTLEFHFRPQQHVEHVNGQLADAMYKGFSGLSSGGYRRVSLIGPTGAAKEFTLTVSRVDGLPFGPDAIDDIRSHVTSLLSGRALESFEFTLKK